MSAAKLFGTDGIRGRAGDPPLDNDTVRAVGRGFAEVMTARIGRAPRVVIGRDTRESGIQIETAFAAGVIRAGGRLDASGVIPTPGVACITRIEGYDAGIVVSASHNPFVDNGLKIFLPDGSKLDDAAEREIERLVPEYRLDDDTLGHVEEQSSHIETYYRFLRDTVSGDLELKGLSLAVDCANGASYQLAPRLFADLGATIHAVGVEPDGRNINKDSGSLHLELVGETVRATGSDLGVAFDGDADRALFVDHNGAPVDGDRIMFLLASDMADRGALEGNRVVATVMSNMGLEVALKERGIALARTAVGDKYVLDELLSSGAALGGEQSGHIIFPAISRAGDGMGTALEVLRAIRRSGRTLEDLTAPMHQFPQVLLNIKVREKRPFDEIEPVARAAAEVETELVNTGRLLLRYSGTENLARVMIEGPDDATIRAQANRIATAIRDAIGQ